jgi:RNA polymerase sigma factor (sigma-70 family)
MTTTSISPLRFEDLYQECSKIIFKTFQSTPTEDVEDALQFAMIEVWQAMQTMPDNTKKWFINRSVMYARNYLRSQSWRHTNRKVTIDQVTEEDTAIEQDKHDHLPSTTEKGYEDVETLSILDGLPQDLQQIIRMAMEAYRRYEIAEFFGVSQWTISRRLSKVREHVQTAAA